MVMRVQSMKSLRIVTLGTSVPTKAAIDANNECVAYNRQSSRLQPRANTKHMEYSSIRKETNSPALDSKHTVYMQQQCSY